MTPSAALKAFTKQSEGCVLRGYKDSGGTITAGYGHTGPDVKFGATITQAQADAWFEADIAEAAREVERLAGPCSQGQFDALTDFVFNLGAQRLAGSTLLHKHKAGDFAGAAEEFGKWVHCKGQVLQGLVRRRAGEVRMYLS